jgi:hypothetical protein
MYYSYHPICESMLTDFSTPIKWFKYHFFCKLIYYYKKNKHKKINMW